MPEIKLEKRFPNVSTEDFCKIFNEGLLTGLKAAGKNAIPIEWIKRYASKKSADDMMDCYWHFWEEDVLKMIDEWEIENETN